MLPRCSPLCPWNAPVTGCSLAVTEPPPRREQGSPGQRCHAGARGLNRTEPGYGRWYDHPESLGRPAQMPTRMFDWQVDGGRACGTAARPEAAVSALAEAITAAGVSMGIVHVWPVMVDGAARPYATVRVNRETGEIRHRSVAVDEPARDRVVLSRRTWAGVVTVLRRGNARDQAAAAHLLVDLAPGRWAADLDEPPSPRRWRRIGGRA